MNNEKVKKVGPVDNDYAVTNVPLDKRKKGIPIFVVLLGFCFLSITMETGASIAHCFAWNDLVKILLIGSFILAFYTGLMTMLGAKTGLSTVVLARFALGSWGAKWADLLLGATQVFWFAVQTAYFSELFIVGLGIPHGWYIPITAFFSLAMGLTVLKGNRGLEIISYLALIPFVYLIIKVPSMAVTAAGGFTEMTKIIPDGLGEMTVISAMTSVIGTFCSGGTNCTNWTRYAKSPIGGFFMGFCAFFIGTIVMVGTGMLGGLALNATDMITVMIKLGIVVMAIIILILNIWTTNASTAYAYGMAGAELFNDQNKSRYVFWGTIIATLLAVLNVYNFFIPFLIFLGVFIPPLGAIVLADHFYNWSKKFPKIEYVSFKRINIPNVIAYILASVCAWVSNKASFFIPSLVGMIAAFVFCFICNKIYEKASGKFGRPDVAAEAEYMYSK